MPKIKLQSLCLFVIMEKITDCCFAVVTARKSDDSSENRQGVKRGDCGKKRSFGRKGKTNASRNRFTERKKKGAKTFYVYCRVLDSNDGESVAVYCRGVDARRDIGERLDGRAERDRDLRRYEVYQAESSHFNGGGV